MQRQPQFDDLVLHARGDLGVNGAGNQAALLKQAQLFGELFLGDGGSSAQQVAKALAETLAALWPRLDAVFLNAGDVTHAPLEAWQEEAWDRLMNINLKGPFFLIQALLPLLNNPSSVILCGSVSARIGLPTSSVYAASKAGLLSLARTLSAELLPRGIRVNGLSPGPVETPAFTKTGLSEEALNAMMAEVIKLVPLGRMGSTA